MNEVKSYVKEARKAAGLSINQVALAADTTPTSIVRIESGTQRPSVKMAKKLAKVLGIEWYRFYDDVD